MKASHTRNARVHVVCVAGTIEKHTQQRQTSVPGIPRRLFFSVPPSRPHLCCCSARSPASHFLTAAASPFLLGNWHEPLTCIFQLRARSAPGRALTNYFRPWLGSVYTRGERAALTQAANALYGFFSVFAGNRTPEEAVRTWITVGKVGQVPRNFSALTRGG